MNPVPVVTHERGVPPPRPGHTCTPTPTSWRILPNPAAALSATCPYSLSSGSLTLKQAQVSRSRRKDETSFNLTSLLASGTHLAPPRWCWCVWHHCLLPTPRDTLSLVSLHPHSQGCLFSDPPARSSSSTCRDSSGRALSPPVPARRALFLEVCQSPQHLHLRVQPRPLPQAHTQISNHLPFTSTWMGQRHKISTSKHPTTASTRSFSWVPHRSTGTSLHPMRAQVPHQRGVILAPIPHPHVQSIASPLDFASKTFSRLVCLHSSHHHQASPGHSKLDLN